MTAKRLEYSIPANNQKIIELYNKLKKEELHLKPIYQRKLVWRKQHKFRFIETILLNFPFPEIYLAPGQLDTDNLIIQDEIVDGQQRLTTIRDYIEEKGVFSLNIIPIQKFSELTKDQKGDFLNYEVSVRYLKNSSQDQVRDIFQRINSTEYSLNKTERLNAQWGDSEFICYAKQIIEIDLDIDLEIVNYKISPTNRDFFVTFFHNKSRVFTENDINRMLALQYILTLLATMLEQKYFRRNEKVQQYIENCFDDFGDAYEIELMLLSTLTFIKSLELDIRSYWFNKANMFTLIVECSRLDLTVIDKSNFKRLLLDLEAKNKEYSSILFEQRTGIHIIDDLAEDFIEGEVTSAETPEIESNSTDIIGVGDIGRDYIKYFEYAKEGVNELSAREFRGNIVKKFLVASLVENQGSSEVHDTTNTIL